ncbi:MAG: RNA polymerase sigma factor [Bacteroidota bacterium]|nr:RNA polymerase sigma factor [Bacteroidota bacterium]
MESIQFNNQILNHSDQLFRLAKSILRNGDAAKDAVQELIMKLWEKRIQLDDVENMQAFMMRSMRNLCLDIIRQQHDEDELPAEFEYAERNPYQQTEQKDFASQIRNMIDKLPELQRTIIRMRDVEGMELAEIAYVTLLTENAVSVNLSRARQKIREQIIKEQKRVEETVWK